MTIFPNSPEMEATWDDLMAGLFSFVADTQADLDIAHDWLCDQLQIDSLLNEETMCEVDDDCWNSFYQTWQSAYDGLTGTRNICLINTWGGLILPLFFNLSPH